MGLIHTLILATNVRGCERLEKMVLIEDGPQVLPIGRFDGNIML